ncbi:MAG: fibrillarin-like rRNA/tRNA 2'-O-methyltransferase [Candidatus Woesearchaeota archaeon]
MKQYKHFKGVYEPEKSRKRSIFTISQSPGKQVYGEMLFREKGVEFREWDPFHSKLGAGLLNGISQIGIKPACSVLYLGVASGTTASHVSDIVGSDGFVFGIDFAPRVLRDFVFLCNERGNLAPILADAKHPESYEHLVTAVDVVFQDIAQKSQVDIFLKNIDHYLKPGGFGLLVIKARSIDVTKKPKEIFKRVRQELESSKVTIVDYKELEPFEKDHALFVVKK